MRVLIVEPDPRVRGFVAGILAEFGHEVHQCGDAAAARRHLGAVAIDVVATDLVLEAQGGMIAVALGWPTVTLTGERFGPNAGEHCRSAPLREKPFRFSDLHALIAAVAEAPLAPLPAAA